MYHFRLHARCSVRSRTGGWITFTFQLRAARRDTRRPDVVPGDPLQVESRRPGPAPARSDASGGSRVALCVAHAANPPQLGKLVRQERAAETLKRVPVSGLNIPESEAESPGVGHARTISHARPCDNPSGFEHVSEVLVAMRLHRILARWAS
jgi:hypothetical protein